MDLQVLHIRRSEGLTPEVVAVYVTPLETKTVGLEKTVVREPTTVVPTSESY